MARAWGIPALIYFGLAFDASSFQVPPEAAAAKKSEEAKKRRGSGLGPGFVEEALKTWESSKLSKIVPLLGRRRKKAAQLQGQGFVDVAAKAASDEAAYPMYSPFDDDEPSSNRFTSAASARSPPPPPPPMPRNDNRVYAPVTQTMGSDAIAEYEPVPPISNVVHSRVILDGQVKQKKHKGQHAQKVANKKKNKENRRAQFHKNHRYHPMDKLAPSMFVFTFFMQGLLG